MEKMTLKEACAFLGVSHMTLYRRMKSGELQALPKNPAHKKAYRVEFLREDIEKLAQGEK